MNIFLTMPMIPANTANGRKNEIDVVSIVDVWRLRKAGIVSNYSAAPMPAKTHFGNVFPICTHEHDNEKKIYD